MSVRLRQKDSPKEKSQGINARQKEKEQGEPCSFALFFQTA
jgi:hypothetical protein